MSKNYKSIEWKTAVCLVFSVALHAGLIYYVALTQFGEGNSEVNQVGQAGVAAPVEFQTVEPSASIPASSEPIVTKEEAPKSESVKPVIKPKEVKQEPKIEVSRPNELPAPKAKIAKVLPKKEVPPASDDNSPVTVAKNEEKQPEPQIEKEEMKEVMPVEKVESMNVEKEVAHEKAVREELVEKIMKDEPNPEQLTIEQGTPKIVEQEAAPTPAPAPVEAKPAAATAEAKPAPTQSVKGDAKTTVVSAIPGGENKSLPVKNDYELKAMPGNKDPEYSSGDRLARRQGEVKFMAEVAVDGSISNIRILKSSGHRTLDLAAYSAFRNYRYHPGQQSYVVKSFVFTLKGPAQVLPSRLGTRTQAAN